MRAIMAEQASLCPTGAYVVRAGPECPQLSFDELKVAMSQAVAKAVRPRSQPVPSGRPLPAHRPAGVGE
jgi:RNase P protein component